MVLHAEVKMIHCTKGTVFHPEHTQLKTFSLFIRLMIHLTFTQIHPGYILLPKVDLEDTPDLLSD